MLKKTGLGKWLINYFFQHLIQTALPVSNAVTSKSTSKINNGKVALTIHNVSDNETEREFIYN